MKVLSFPISSTHPVYTKLARIIYNGKYFAKQQKMKQFASSTIQTFSSLNFNQSCNNYGKYKLIKILIN